MYFKVICATLVCSTIVLIGFLRVHRWNWLRIKRPKEEAIETTLPISRTNTPPIDQTEEVKAKPMLCPGPSTQHLQHDGVDVYVISSMTECEEILSSIPRQNLCLLGFDCEWAQSYHLDEIVQAARGDCLSAFVYPIALIQIATMDSRCYLIRLSQMQNQIPPSLVDILLDEKCLKFGVSSLNDLNRIKNHYLIHPKGAVDLRHLAYHRMIGQRLGLQGLSKHFLGIELNKDPQLQRSNWQSQNLTFQQIKYASIDAKVSLDILFAILQIICKERSIPQAVQCPSISSEFIDLVFDICGPLIDIPFGGGSSKTQQRQRNNSGSIHSIRSRNRTRNRIKLPYNTNQNFTPN